MGLQAEMRTSCWRRRKNKKLRWRNPEVAGEGCRHLGGLGFLTDQPIFSSGGATEHVLRKAHKPSVSVSHFLETEARLALEASAAHQRLEPVQYRLTPSGGTIGSRQSALQDDATMQGVVCYVFTENSNETKLFCLNRTVSEISLCIEKENSDTSNCWYLTMFCSFKFQISR